jgi:hypothetical protein
MGESGMELELMWRRRGLSASSFGFGGTRHQTPGTGSLRKVELNAREDLI